MLKNKTKTETEDFDELNKKVEAAFCLCSRHPKDGGNPLLYVVTATLPQYLKEELSLVKKTLHEFNLLENLCVKYDNGNIAIDTNEVCSDDPETKEFIGLIEAIKKHKAQVIMVGNQGLDISIDLDSTGESNLNIDLKDSIYLTDSDLKNFKGYNGPYNDCGSGAFCSNGFLPLPLTIDIISECDLEVKDVMTTSTNGKCINWGKKHLRKLSIKEVCITLIHEGFHVLLSHCIRDFNCKTLFEKFIMNVSMDVTVNSTIKKTFVDNNYGGALWPTRVPMTVDIFIDCINAQKDLELRNSMDPKYLKAYREGFVIPDLTMYNKSAIEIYKYILERIKFDICDADIGYEGSSHETIDLTPSERMQTLLKAKNFSERAGYNNITLTEGINHFLDELYNPKLKLGEMLRILDNQKKIKNGSINNYKSYKKRFLHSKLYYPEKIKYKSNFLVFIDTSGSMNEEALKRSISELRSLNASATIVPGDTQCYWDKITTIDDLKSIHELMSINLTGGGGTAFRCFFDEYPKKVGLNFAGIIVLTDGGFDHEDFPNNPHLPTLWVLTDKIEFDPPFGKRVYIDGY
jgi:predicted metal-dependent peptidase